MLSTIYKRIPTNINWKPFKYLFDSYSAIGNWNAVAVAVPVVRQRQASHRRIECKHNVIEQHIRNVSDSGLSNGIGGLPCLASPYAVFDD